MSMAGWGARPSASSPWQDGLAHTAEQLSSISQELDSKAERLFPRDATTVAWTHGLATRAAELLPPAGLYEAALTTISERGHREADGRMKFDDTRDGSAYSALKTIVDARTRIERRLLTLRHRFAAASAEDDGKLWEAVRADVADPVRGAAYRGLKIDPQWGLRPLGRDPASGLQEFAHLYSGALPRRDATTGLLRLDADAAIVLVLIPPGRFSMGSQSVDVKGRNYDPEATADESPVHEVEVPAFLLSKYECTAAQWSRLRGEGPDPTRVPAVASWQDAHLWLTRFGLGLPTEAQWEYACRANTDTPWWTGVGRGALSEAAWWDQGDKAAPHLVGAKAANGFGLHDVHGNVWEWCEDRFSPYNVNLQRIGSMAGSRERVLRGGCCRLRSWFARSATRHRSDERNGDAYTGWRPVRVLTR